MKLQELITYYRLPIAPGGHTHSRPGWIQLDCPYCGRDSQKFHLGFKESGGYFNCWKCGRLSTKQTLVLLFGIGWDEAQKASEAIRAQAGVTFERAEKVVGSLKRPPGVGPLSSRHRRYLKRRGFDPDILEDLWKIQGIESASVGWPSWSIYIPVIYDGEEVSWTSRKTRDDVEQRYWSASLEQEKIEHKKLVYGYDYIEHTVIVHEGPTDVWKTGPGSVGTFGTAFLSGQVRLLSQVPRRLICFDSSKAAQQRAQILASLLAPFPGSTEIIELDAEDPGSASVKETRKLRRYAGLSS